MNRILQFTLVFYLFVLSAPSVIAQNYESGWRAGTATVKITPKQNIWMAGYASRVKPAEGKIHDLWAKALYLEDSEGNSALLITTDLLAFSKTISDRIRDGLQSSMGLTRAQIILNSSHTHTGPVLTNALRNIYPLDSLQQEQIKNYSGWLVDRILDLAKKAKRNAQPVSVYENTGVLRFQVNRRNNRESRLSSFVELKGPNDYDVPVLKIENKRGKIKAIVFGYACHPTVLNSYEWSGDYPGFAQLELENKYKGATALFFQGAGADQNPMPRRSVALAQQYGIELAAAVERVLKEEMNPLSPFLSVGYSEIKLGLDDPPKKEELEILLNNSVDYMSNWAQKLLHNIENGKPVPDYYNYPVQFWQVGEKSIISLGGEVVSDYSIKLRRILGKDVIVMGYSNDVMAYIPSEQVLREGGYEGETSQMVYNMPSTWEKSIERDIIREVIALAERTGKEISDSLKEVAAQIIETPVLEINSLNRKKLTATRYYSGFEFAHDTYNAISGASDGKIYYVLSSQEIDTGGQVYVYDPETDSTKWLADLTEICGEKGKKTIVQGKSHTRFYECDGKLYFSTHVGFYEIIDGMERLPVHPPEGYKLYPGGHFLSYDLAGEEFEDLAIAPDGEGILTMTMDKERKQIYGITWPKGYFIHLDLNTGKLHNAGLVSENGEAGRVGEDYRVICRSMFVDHRDGKVYYSTAEGDIVSYHPTSGEMNKLEDVNLRIDYFGKYDYTGPGSMAYNWRAITWDPEEEAAWGVHGNSGYLFRFDPTNKKIEVVDRITSELSRKSGMFDQFSYGYLGFDLGHDKKTLYYLTGGPIYIDGKRVKGVDEIAMGAARGLENLHLITYYIPQNKYVDHGPVFYQDGSRPTYVNSIAFDKDGNVYTLARFEHEGKLIEDLIKIPNPF